MIKHKQIRCVNIDTNVVRNFPEHICYNAWWQKTTRFIPQPIDIVIESTIINSNVSESTSVNVETNTEVVSDAPVQTKRKYKKRKSNGIN